MKVFRTDHIWLNVNHILRIMGLMAVISYMTVILFVWIYADMRGYDYFTAGEPVSLVKYSEWVLGFIGIYAVVDSLRKELGLWDHRVH